MIESFQRIVEYAKGDDKELVLESFALLCEATSLSSSCKQWSVMVIWMNCSGVEASEKHPEWKSALRIELLCCCLSNPLFIDQSTDLFNECITGTSFFNLLSLEHTQGTCCIEENSLTHVFVQFFSHHSYSPVCYSSVLTTTPTKTIKHAQLSSILCDSNS